LVRVGEHGLDDLDGATEGVRMSPRQHRFELFDRHGSPITLLLLSTQQHFSAHKSSSPRRGSEGPNVSVRAVALLFCYTAEVESGRIDNERLERVLRSELAQLRTALGSLPSRFFTERAPLLARCDEISDRLGHLASPAACGTQG